MYVTSVAANARTVCTRARHHRRLWLPRCYHLEPSQTFIPPISGPFITGKSIRRLFSTSPQPASEPSEPGRLSHSRSPDQRFRVAVIGSGPAGFYTTHRVISSVPGSRVDIYEALPAPFGLVRYGVAPDHPEVKSCEERFGQVAQSTRVRFVGNVAVGQAPRDPTQGSVSLSVLRRHYDAVVFAYGASQDKLLRIPGESELAGIYSARQFVGWYNGHPDHTGLAPDLDGEEAVIIGQGNVALDVARILLSHVDHLKTTDISEEALAHLSRSRVKRVHVVGRRGPMQASFTIKEVRELLRLPHVPCQPIDATLIPQDISGLPRPSRRLMDVLLKGATAPADATATRSWSLDFCLSPREFQDTDSSGGLTSPNHVSSSVFEKIELTSPFEPKSGTQPLGKLVEIPSHVVFRSTGYRSVPLEGLLETGVQFNQQTGAILNDGAGRAVRPIGAVDDQLGSQSVVAPVLVPVPGMYCSGWVKRGPTGVIASTMQDAFDTADTLCRDWLAGVPFLPNADHHALDGEAAGTSSAHLLTDLQSEGEKDGWEGVMADGNAKNVHSIKVVDWKDWQRLDEAEIKRGQERGKVREKFTTTKEMLQTLV